MVKEISPTDLRKAIEVYKRFSNGVPSKDISAQMDLIGMYNYTTLRGKPLDKCSPEQIYTVALRLYFNADRILSDAVSEMKKSLVNDNLGHLVDSEVLRMLSRMCELSEEMDSRRKDTYEIKERMGIEFENLPDGSYSAFVNMAFTSREYDM